MDGTTRVGRRAERRSDRRVVRSEEELQAVARKFAEMLVPGDVVCLEGDLSSGKTTFVKGIAEYFGIDEVVTSPTFVYCQQYGSPNFKLSHFDLYRLPNEAAFLNLGLEEYIGTPYIACIEWPDILETVLPKEAYWISLKHHPEGREYEITR